MSETIVAGKYRILRRLAAGGMGEVCLAAQVGPAGYERVVALKRMLPTLTVDRELLKLFLDEARLIALLNHRNICQVIELGEDADGYFVAMEMVNGPSVHGLLERLRRGVVLLDPYYAIDIASQVAEALSYAYTAPARDGQPLRIIHRDVTPHNVLLSTSGDVKLIDFGVAKSTQQQHSTESGTVKGKMGYLSPEQSMGRKLDGRSDLFSLGIMLYEMVTLNNPFARADMMAMVRSIQLEDVPPLSSINPAWAPFDPVVSHLLAKLPEHRYADAQAAAEALQDLRPLFPRPAKRLGVFVSDHFGSDLAELARSVSSSDARKELEGTLRSSGAVVATTATPSDPGAAPSADSQDEQLEAARGTPTLYISGPKRAAVAPGPVPAARVPSDESVVRRAMPRSMTGPLAGGLAVIALVGGGVWFGSHHAAAADTTAVADAPPAVPVTQPLAAPADPAPPPVAQPPPPLAVGMTPTAAPVPTPSPAPAVAPTPTMTAAEAAEAAVRHGHHGKHRKSDDEVAAASDDGAVPTSAPAPEAAPAVGTLHVSGQGPQVLKQPSGHVDLQDASGHYRVGLDYVVAGGQLRAKLTTSPWAIVYVNGPSSGNTKDKAVDLGAIGSAPLRVELEHPDVERGKLVMTFESR